MPRGEFKYRYWFFANTPNVTWIVSVIWKDLLWRPNFYCHLKYRGGCTIPMFQLSLPCEKCAAARHNRVIGNQLLFANNRNRVRWVVLCLSQNGACTDSFENFLENSLKGDLSTDNTLNPPLFSLVKSLRVEQKPLTFNSGWMFGFGHRVWSYNMTWQHWTKCNSRKTCNSRRNALKNFSACLGCTYNFFAHTILNLCWVCTKNCVCWVCAKHFLVHDECVLKYLSCSHAEGAPKNLCAHSACTNSLGVPVL